MSSYYETNITSNKFINFDASYQTFSALQQVIYSTYPIVVQDFNIFAYTNPTTNIITFGFQIYTPDKTYSTIACTIIIVKQSPNFYGFYAPIKSGNLFPMPLTFDANIPNDYFQAQTQYNCIIGLHKLWWPSIVSRILDISDAMNPLQLTFTNINSINIHGLCIFTFCSYNCTVCDFMHICLQCGPKTILINDSCTSVLYCSSLNLNINYTTTCIQCRPLFTLIDHNCYCINGTIISGQCVKTLIFGCLTYILNALNTDTQCYKCNVGLNMQLDPVNNKCVCINGYYFQANQCKQICGDGLLFYLKCDDGNTNDGDGCDHVCKVEKQFQCIQLVANSSSVCKYLRKVYIKLISQRTSWKTNIAKFKFSIRPALSFLQHFDLSSYFHMSLNKSYQNVKWTYKQGIIYLQFRYLEDIHKQTAIFDFSFDLNYVLDSNQSLSVIVLSQNVMFKIFNSPYHIHFQYFFIIYGLVSLFVFVVGSFFNKSAPLQHIISLQILYVLSVSGNQYTRALSTISYVSAIFLNNPVNSGQQNNLWLGPSNKNFIFSSDCLHIFVYCFVGYILMSYLYFLGYIILENISRQLEIFKKTKNYFYHHIYIPFGVVSILLSHRSIIYHIFSEHIWYIVLIVVMISNISVVFFTQLFYNQQSKKRNKSTSKQIKAHHYYFPMFLFTIMLIEEIICFSYLYFQISPLILITVCLFIVYCIFGYTLPYQQTLDIWRCFIVFITPLLLGVFLILQQKLEIFASQSDQISFLLILSIFMIISLILTILSIVNKFKQKIRQICQFCQQNIQQDKKEILIKKQKQFRYVFYNNQQQQNKKFLSDFYQKNHIQITNLVENENSSNQKNQVLSLSQVLFHNHIKKKKKLHNKKPIIF